MADVTTLDDIENSQSRRNWLNIIAATLGIGGLGWFLFGDVNARPLDLSIAIDPNIDALSITDGVLEVQIAEDTAGDEWAIMHEYHSDSSDAFVTGRVPEFGGRIEVPIKTRVDQSHLDFPTKRFQFVVYELVRDDERDRVVPMRLSGVEFEIK